MPQLEQLYIKLICLTLSKIIMHTACVWSNIHCMEFIYMCVYMISFDCGTGHLLYAWINHSANGLRMSWDETFWDFGMGYKILL